MAETQTSNCHVVMLPGPGMGHVIPFIEFAKRLTHIHDNFHVTVIIPSIGHPPNAVKASLQALPPSITYIFPASVIVNDEPDGTTISDLFKLAITRALPTLQNLLKSLTTNVAVYDSVVFLADPFTMNAFDVTIEFNIPAYVFFPSGAMALSLFFCLPKLEEMVPPSTEFKDLPEPVRIPGCIPVHGKDLPDPMQDRKSGKYKWFLDSVKRFRFAKGVAVNTFMDLEAGPLKALIDEKEPGFPPVYPVGPVVRNGSNDKVNDGPGSDCLTWLDNQPRGSVLFVSFGSGGTLSHAQLTELALGLEISGQRFIWVIRNPNDDSVTSSIFSNNKSQQNPFDFLPEGFLERTERRGFVIPSWAPQAQILSHVSTGGFLTHCGWNSTLESVVSGVSLIAWPLYAEQKMNAVMLTEDMKVALRPEMNENGLIGHEEIAKLVSGLMEGEEGKGIRIRMKELKNASEKALDEDGSSTKSLSRLALEWKRVNLSLER